MKKTVFIIMTALLWISLSPAHLLSQTEGQTSQLYLIAEFIIKPSLVGPYEAVVKEFFELQAEHNFAYPINGFNMDDFHYFYGIPLKNYDELDEFFKAKKEHIAKVGSPKWQELIQRESAAYEYYKYALYLYEPDLSYAPENPRLKPEEMSFISYQFCSVLPGRDKEFKEVLKEWAALHREKGIADGFETYKGDIGTEKPFYILCMRAKSAEDYRIQENKIFEIFGEEKVMKLREKTAALLRKYEKKTGWSRQDLSYVPKGMRP
jgi:hypothetical protein